MRNVFFNAIVAAAILVGVATVQAQGITLGEPGYGGSGCPAGSASVTLSPDSKALSIIFDQYIVEAGGITGRTLDRKSCNISIPLNVPHGYSVSIFKVDYRGFNFLPRNGQSRFTAEYFFAGGRGPILSKQFRGPLNDTYTFTNNLIAEALVWSPCGAQTNLRVNSSMQTFTNTAQEQTMSTVDSADIEAGLIYHIQWRRCT
jgi:hypothetical protein